MQLQENNQWISNQPITACLEALQLVIDMWMNKEDKKNVERCSHYLR